MKIIPFYRREIAAHEQLKKIISLRDEESALLSYKEACVQLFKSIHSAKHFALTKSCTQSLETALLLAKFPVNSEIILPSYSFVSLANAISMRGYRCIFVDCDPETMNICPSAVAAAIGPNTRAIITINYSGVSCDYDKLIPLCNKHKLILIEDNAHGFLCTFNGKRLGQFGDISTISFDYLKNISCFEGGGISINNPEYLETFRQVYEFGTNRLDVLEGKSSFYEWKCIGSNHTLAEPLAAILYDQMLLADDIIVGFRRHWEQYFTLLSPLKEVGLISLCEVPKGCTHNGHMFWLKTNSEPIRNDLMLFLKSFGIQTAFHYTPLHTSEFGRKAGIFKGEDRFTSKESGKLLRLPMYYSLSEAQIIAVVKRIYQYFKIDPESL
jgi:dTDP-4-amino-4,6-dideoxygalactose transaminase